MATGASVVKRYELANREERVELLIENYGCFDDILDIELITIENRIKALLSEKEAAVRAQDFEAAARITSLSKGSSM